MEFVEAKSIVSSGYAEHNGWFGCNYNMNIYRGCCHGCIYCDSRSECYGVERFDTVRAKKDALLLIERELKSKRRTGVIGTGSMSDPYNPFEKQQGLTRAALTLIRDNGFGVAIATKSPMVARDIDVLCEIKKHAPVLVKMTVTAADDTLCRKIEQHAPPTNERIEALGKLSARGIFCGILLMPVLPFLEDTEENIRDIINMAKKSGARFIYPQFGVTLRVSQRDWFFNKLDVQFPGVKEQYREAYGDAYECISPRARELAAFFRRMCGEEGILYRMQDIIRAYKEPYEQRQMTLF